MPLSLPPIVYCGEIADPARGWLVWNDAAPIWAALLAWAALTARHAPRSRPAWAAWALALLLYLSPLCALSATLFSVRVLHHLLLVGAVAPLLALAAGPARAGQRRARSPAGAALVFGLFYEHIGWRGMFFVGIIPALLVVYIMDLSRYFHTLDTDRIQRKWHR